MGFAPLPLYILSDLVWIGIWCAPLKVYRNFSWGTDLLCKWSVQDFWPIQCGPPLRGQCLNVRNVYGLEFIEVKFNMKLSRAKPVSRLAFEMYLRLIIVNDDKRLAILRGSGMPNVTD